MDGSALTQFDIEPAQDDARSAFQEAHRRTRNRDKQQHGRSHSHCKRLSPAQGQRLRHQFANHYVEVGNDRKAQRHGNNVRVEQRMRLDQREQAEPAEYHPGGEGFANPAERQGAERDAELDGGKKVIQIVLQAANGPRPRNVGGQHLLVLHEAVEFRRL